MPAGDVTDGVVRVGGTIRRPHQPQPPAVAAYLDRMEHNARVPGGRWARTWEDGVGGLIRRRGDWLEATAARLLAALAR